MLNHAKMIITCPECATRYQIDASKFPDEGREVKCTSCAHNWFQDYEGLVPAELTEDISGSGPKPEFAKAGADKNSIGEEGSEEENDSTDVISEPEAPVSIEQQASRLMKNAKSFHVQNKRERTQQKSVAKKIMLLAASAIIVGALGVKFRTPIVKKIPEIAFIYEKIGLPVNVRGLDFVGVEAVRDFQNGIPILAIKGEILNVTQKTQNTPSLRYALYNDRDQEVYHWVVPLQIKSLDPNTSLPIAARLAAPPAEASKLEVRFVRERR